MASKRITKHKGRYSNEARARAGVEWAICGSYVDTAKATGIGESTLRGWKDRGHWDEVIAEVRASNTDRNIAQYDRLTYKALRAADKGIDALEGKELSPADIKALVISGAATTDKSRLLQNLPTSVTQRGDSMTELKEQFRRLSSSYQLVPKSTIIEQEKGPIDEG